MRSWIQGLGGREHDVLQRLTKQAVREHRNIRGAGEGGAPAAQGTFAQHAGVEAQHDIQGYLHGVPGVAQAESLFGKVGNLGSSASSIPGVGQMFNMMSPGGRRNSPGVGGASGYPGPPTSQSGYSGPPPSSSGQAGSYYSASQTTVTPSGGMQTSSYSSSTYPTSPQAGSYYTGTTPSSYGPPPPLLIDAARQWYVHSA